MFFGLGIGGSGWRGSPCPTEVRVLSSMDFLFFPRKLGDKEGACSHVRNLLRTRGRPFGVRMVRWSRMRESLAVDVLSGSGRACLSDESEALE